MKSLGATALATAGLTTAAFALASPAMAATGDAVYNCGTGYTAVGAEFTRDISNRLVVTADLSPTGFTVPSNNTTIVATLNANPGQPQVVLNAGTYQSITLTTPGTSFPNVSSAPGTITLSVTGVPAMNCTLVAGSANWPVGGV